MFKLSAILVVLAAGLELANAVPAAPEPSQVVPNADGHVTPGLDAYKAGKSVDGLVALAAPGVFICANSQFVEPCLYIPSVTPGACYTLTGLFVNSLSSLGPDRGLKCYGYLNSNCTPAHPNLGPINYPGIDVKEQFVQDGVDYHDRVNSFICWNS